MNDDIFSFIVGREEECFKVHVSALSAISGPLAYMMTNNAMEESTKKEATLKSTKPQVFAQLVKFAYMGLCGIADSVAKLPLFNIPKDFQCHRCRQYGSALMYPFCSETCREELVSMMEYGDPEFVFWCVARGCSRTLTYRTYVDLTCSNHDHELYPTVSRDFQPISETPESACRLSFVDRQYACESMSYTVLKEHIQAHLIEASPMCPLVQHAELYVCAQEYMVRDLREICLHKLHHNLVWFEIDDESVEEIVDLVIYIYENTADEGNVLDGTADKLRDLVMAFVVDQARLLTKYDSFSQMIGAGGAHTTDFFKLTYQQKE